MSITRNTLNDTAITKDFHERILTIDNTSDTSEVNKLPVANQYGYLDNSWLKDYSSYKIKNRENHTVITNFTTTTDESEFIDVITLGSRITITLAGDYVDEGLPYSRALVYRFLIYNPDSYDLTWETDYPNGSFIWNTYSETPPTLDTNGTYIEFISTDRGLHWYGIATDMTAYDIVHNYYTKSESDDRFVNVTGDTMTDTLTISKSNGNNLILKNETLSKETTPTTDLYNTITFTDKNGVTTGSIGHNTTASNDSIVYINTKSNVSSSNTEASISVKIDNNDTIITHAPTPPTNDISTQIATTAYVRNYIGDNVEHWLVPEMTNETKFMCLTNDGDSSYWVRYSNEPYVYVASSNITSITVPSQYLTDAIITSVYRNGVLLVNPDDYTINISTGVISFKDTITDGEKIIVTLENAVKLHSNEVLTGVTLNNSTASTPESTDSSNRIATTEYVNRVLDSYSGSGGSSIPTHSPSFTGTPTAPTAADGTNTTQIATTAFVNTAISNSNHAPINSPNFTGIPTAPNASASTDNTQIANTKFVNTAISNLVDNATLDTLNKLSSAVNNDANYYITVNTALNNKLNIGITTTGGGNAVTSITDLNGDITIEKGSTFSLSNHNHNTEYTALSTSIGDDVTPIYTDDNGTLTASNVTVGSEDTPVYLSNGSITSTNKSFSNYLPLVGGTITGDLNISDSLIVGDPEDQHIEFTNNSIQSRSDDTTANDIYLNENGGDVYFGDINNRVTISNGVVTADSFIGNIGGTSEKASMDALGNVIDTTYAPLDSPDLTGVPTAPTASAGTNSTQIATTEYVDTALASLVNSAPATLDTLNELAAALGNDPNFATTVSTSIGEKLDSDSSNYIKDISISGDTITITKGDDSTDTLTTQDTTYTSGAGLTLYNNEFSLNTASTTDLGGVIIGNGISISNGVISADDQLPDQTNNSGKFLTTNGSSVSWATVDALPSQTNNAGKVLTTNGSVASWSDPINEIKISSIHYPATGATTITLTDPQSIPNDVNKYALSVYRDGIYLNQSIDYGFNSDTNTLTFVKAFEIDEIVSVIFTYVSVDSQTSVDLDVEQYEAGSNVTFTPNAITNKTTISSSDTVTTATTTGSGNAVTSVTANNGALTITKGSTFVDLSNDQTIAGSKTYTSRIIEKDQFRVQTDDITKGNLSTAVTKNTTLFDFVDTTPSPIASLYSEYNITSSSNYSNKISLLAYDPSLSSYTYSGIGIGYNQDGVFTFAPTPATSDNSTQIATTAYVKSNLNSYATLASPAFTGYPTIESSPSSTDNTTKIATTAYVNTRLGIPIEKVTTLTSSSNITIDPANGSLFTLTLDTNSTITLASISNGYYTTNGAIVTLLMPAHNYAITWSNVIWDGGSAPDNLDDGFNIITFVTANGGTTWYGNALSISSS